MTHPPMLLGGARAVASRPGARGAAPNPSVSLICSVSPKCYKSEYLRVTLC